LQDGKRELFIQNDESYLAEKLLELTANQYNTTPEEYCERMQRRDTWGGML
jgi:hypothetical protein